MEDRKDSKGGFQPGNKFWEARSSHGAKPKFANPEDLWSACVEYFDWMHNNPLYEDKVFPSTGHESIAHMRAMTITGLCIFLDITLETWTTWRTSRHDLSEVMKKAEAIIYQQKFEGASAGFLNANIIARDLGLTDKQETSGTVNVVQQGLGFFYGESPNPKPGT